MDTSLFQVGFYVLSPLLTLLAVGTAYLALVKQAKPLILIYYQPSDDIASIIELVVCNHGNGTARNIRFSEPLPIRCWGIEEPGSIDLKGFMSDEIPALAPGREFRYDGGQYGGLYSIIGDCKNIEATYKYKSPLRFEKVGRDASILDIRYMQRMASRNSVSQDVSDAMKGINNTVFSETNKALKSISDSLLKIVLHFDRDDE